MSAEQAIAFFDGRRSEFLAQMLDLLRIRSISTDPDHGRDMARCAEWLRDKLAEAGLETRILQTAGHPAVFADSGPDQGSGLTILFYGHYDVQPTGDVSLWNSPPFEPTVRDGAIYARGSADDKGQLMTHLAAVTCWKHTGRPWPVRLKFIIEGEEEIGSRNLPELIREHRDLLACDYIVLSDTSKHDADTPALTVSTRGLVYKHITVEGPAHDLHSGIYGGMVANPANVLATIIASLHDADRRVTIPGFYDDVAEPSADQRARLAEHPLSDEQLLSATGSPVPFGEAGWTNFERRGLRPTLDVNGMVGGYTGSGSATILPARASAKISMRLVANQDPDRVSRAFDDAVRRVCPNAVRLTIETSATCAPYMTPLESPGMAAADKALTQTFGRRPVMLPEGGSLPILPMFKRLLDADSLMLGFAMPDCNLHGPNEFFHIRDFELGTRAILRFMEEIGKR